MVYTYEILKNKVVFKKTHNVLKTQTQNKTIEPPFVYSWTLKTVVPLVSGGMCSHCVTLKWLSRGGRQAFTSG